jgi:Bacteriophage head to tail connecting protein
MDGPTILRHFEGEKSLRSKYENHYRDCYLYTDPLRADGFSGTMDHEQAEATKALLCDSTAADALRMFTSSLLTGMTPSNSRWFGLEVGGQTDEERRWLDNASETVWLNVHNANYDAEAMEAAHDLGIVGWFVLFIDENTERGGYAFEAYDVGSCFITSTRPDGYPDVLFRPYSLSAEQAVSAFGEDMLPGKIREAAVKSPSARFEFVHHIRPRKDAKPNSPIAKHLPFGSWHVCKESKQVVRESGYHECPFIAPRMKRISPQSAYGIGPVSDALPDIKSLNELCRMELDAAGMAVEGQYIAEDDGVINPRMITLGRKKIIVANSVDSIKALPSGSDFNVSFTIKADLKEAIRKTLMADPLPPADGPAKSATEYNIRVQVARQLLGPIYGRLQAEWLQRMVERCFGIAFRAGVLGQPPESLQNKEYSVTFQSPMARAQKMEDVYAMDRYEVALGNQAMQLAQIDPDAAVDLFDNYDADLASRTRAELLGVPADLIVDKRLVEKRRMARQQAKQQQAQQAIMAQGAQAAAVEGGKAMGQQLAGAA